MTTEKFPHPGNNQTGRVYSRVFQMLFGLEDRATRSTRGESVRPKGLNALPFACIRSCVAYIRDMLSQNIKRDCMADLCKYPWPADKRVSAEAYWKRPWRGEGASDG